MSTPASFSGAAYSRTASTVSSPNGSSLSISGTSRGHATAVERTPASSVRTSCCVAARRRPSPAVASRPIRRLRVACTAACASGVITPTTGTASSSCSCGSAADVAALQATTISFTPCASRKRADLVREARGSPASGRGPVRQPRVVAEVDEVLVRHRHEALVEDGQPAHPGVEHADRPRIHRAIVEAAGYGARRPVVAGATRDLSLPSSAGGRSPARRAPGNRVRWVFTVCKGAVERQPGGETGVRMLDAGKTGPVRKARNAFRDRG